MIVSPFFEHTLNQPEQNLLDDLIVECIAIHGLNTYYIARDMQNYDPIYGTDEQSTYERTWLIEMYLENVMGFEGDREFMSKFAGLEIRDQIVFAVSKTRFEQEIAEELVASRPREGDLLYFAQNEKCFQIKFCNQVEMMFPFGVFYFYKLTCELFEYSGEAFNTGIKDIDKIQANASLNVLDYLIYDTDGTTPLLTPHGDYLTSEKYKLNKIAPLADNLHLTEEEKEKEYIDWEDVNPFSTDDSGSHII
jgi:hypothetical protein